MRRFTVPAAAVACAALAAAVIASASSGARQAEPPTGTLELVSPDRQTRFTFVDNAPRGRESRGDMAVISGAVRSTDGATRGRIQAYFVATVGGDFERRFRGQVSATLSLPDGDIVFEGVTDDRRDVEPLVIAGGTGAYAGARGVVRVTESRRATRFALTFMP